MRKNNPAVYECPKAANTLHCWKQEADGTFRCIRCKLKLNAEDSADCLEDRSLITLTIPEAIDALRHREPFDENETMCGVSREALDVVLAYVASGPVVDDAAVSRARIAYCENEGISLFEDMRAALLAAFPAPTAEADTLERAAKVCDKRATYIRLPGQTKSEAQGYSDGAAACAQDLRALASQPPQAPAAMPSEGELREMSRDHVQKYWKGNVMMLEDAFLAAMRAVVERMKT